MVQFFTLWHFFARTWQQKHPACISLASLFNTQHLFSFVFLPLIWEPHSTACVQWALSRVTEFWCILYIKGIKGSERETNNIGFLEIFLHTFDPTHCTLAEGLQTWLSFCMDHLKLGFLSINVITFHCIYICYVCCPRRQSPPKFKFKTEVKRRNTEPLSPYHRIAESSICNIFVLHVSLWLIFKYCPIFDLSCSKTKY